MTVTDAATLRAAADILERLIPQRGHHLRTTAAQLRREAHDIEKDTKA